MYKRNYIQMYVANVFYHTLFGKARIIFHNSIVFNLQVGNSLKNKVSDPEVRN